MFLAEGYTTAAMVHQIQSVGSGGAQ